MASVAFSATVEDSEKFIGDLQKSQLEVGSRVFSDPKVEMELEKDSSIVRGHLQFELDSSMPLQGDYKLAFCGVDAYDPAVNVHVSRSQTAFQNDVGMFLGGYLSKEHEVTSGSASVPNMLETLESKLLMPDVPQQENATDCGYFILEQILRVLQLPAAVLRALASKRAEDLAMLPWPSQEEVADRKVRLRDALGTLFEAAHKADNNDVECLLKADVELRAKVRSALWEGTWFAQAAKHVAEENGPDAGASVETADCENGLLQLPSIALRSLCIRRGCVPFGTLQRSDLLAAITGKQPIQEGASAGEHDDKVAELPEKRARCE